MKAVSAPQATRGVPGLVSVSMILAIVTGATACKGSNKSTSTLPASPAQEGELGKVVARVDDSVITLGDVQDGINKQAPFVRARYTSQQ